LVFSKNYIFKTILHKEIW